MFVEPVWTLVRAGFHLSWVHGGILKLCLMTE